MKYIINLFGGPGCGKSTCASYIFSKLKSEGIHCEYLTEFAKTLTYERNKIALSTQMYVTGVQIYSTKLLLQDVDIIITDSPILLGCIYTDSIPVKAAIISEHDALLKSAIMVNVKINRKKNYETYGRNQSFEEAKKLDAIIDDLLNKQIECNNDRNIFFEIDGVIEDFEKLLKFILEIVNN